MTDRMTGLTVLADPIVTGLLLEPTVVAPVTGDSRYTSFHIDEPVDISVSAYRQHDRVTALSAITPTTTTIDIDAEVEVFAGVFEEAEFVVDPTPPTITIDAEVGEAPPAQHTGFVVDVSYPQGETLGISWVQSYQFSGGLVSPISVHVPDGWQDGDQLFIYIVSMTCVPTTNPPQYPPLYGNPSMQLVSGGAGTIWAGLGWLGDGAPIEGLSTTRRATVYRAVYSSSTWPTTMTFTAESSGTNPFAMGTAVVVVNTRQSKFISDLGGGGYTSTGLSNHTDPPSDSLLFIEQSGRRTATFPPFNWISPAPTEVDLNDFTLVTKMGDGPNETLPLAVYHTTHPFTGKPLGPTFTGTGPLFQQVEIEPLSRADAFSPVIIDAQGVAETERQTGLQVVAAAENIGIDITVERALDEFWPLFPHRHQRRHPDRDPRNPPDRPF